MEEFCGSTMLLNVIIKHLLAGALSTLSQIFEIAYQQCRYYKSHFIDEKTNG
jgi:hypothetical protein